MRIAAATLIVLALLSETERSGIPVLDAQGPASVSAAPRYVDRTQLMQDATTLSGPAFEGREAGSPGGLKARQWIADQFDAIRVMQSGSIGYLQPFTVTTRNARAILPGGRPFRIERAAANVIGLVPSRETRARKIVVTAHYDHLGIRNGVLFPGADDNASGVAALLAAARYFVAHPPRHPMIVAVLDAEEIGLRGAHVLIDSGLLAPKEVVLNVNLDMVSRNDANQIYAAGTYHSPALKPILDDVQTRASVTILFGHDKPAQLANGLEDWTQSSDHGPFHEADVPFIYFGVEDHPDYHKPTDTADRIDPRFFGDVVDMLVEALRTFDARLE